MSAPTITLSQAISMVRVLGLPPVGSPAAIREHAVALRRAADVLDGAAAQLGSCVHVGGYLGPAARRHEADTDHETRMLHDRVARLRQLASRLDGEANALDGRQRSWRSSFAGKAAALPGNLGHQALNHLGWKLP